MISEDEIFLAIQTIALRDTLLNKGFGSIFRYYSERFVTPLHVVETLPVEDVLYHVMCDKYQKRLEDDDEDPEWIKDEIALLTQDPKAIENKIVEKLNKKKADDDEMDRLLEEAAEENVKNELEAAAEIAEDLANKLTKIKDAPAEPVTLEFVSDVDLEKLANMTPEEVLAILKP